MRKTKIICTIGPKSESVSVLTQLLSSGMNAMRLNFSHGSYFEHFQRIKNLSFASKKTGKQFAIILDTKGPEIRTMQLEKHSEVFLRTGQIFSLKTDSNSLGNNKHVSITDSRIINNISIGNTILIDDGLLCMIVKKIIKKDIICKTLNSGFLGENKSVSIPEMPFSFPTLSEKDKNDLEFGCKQNVDFIAASFIRKAKDVIKIRKFLNRNGGKNIQIISKIENQEGINNFDEILEISDGIMVARGDLGVEIPIEKVIFAQKMIIKKCNAAKKFVITATQMLESMIHNPRPTRAEAGDITNAILDGTDAVMLSGESAKGKYPVESVKTMSVICNHTDKIINQRIHIKDKLKDVDVTEIVCKNAVNLSKNLHSPLIIVATKQGKSVKSIRKYFPDSIILALTYNRSVSRHLILNRGVVCHLIQKKNFKNCFYSVAKSFALKKKFAKKGDTIVIISGYLKFLGAINTISLHVL